MNDISFYIERLLNSAYFSDVKVEAVSTFEPVEGLDAETDEVNFDVQGRYSATIQLDINASYLSEGVPVMNDLISNKRTGYLLIIALAAVVFGAIYYFLIYPLNEEKNSKETSITTVENEIALLDAQSVVPVEEAGNSMFLEKKFLSLVN